MSQTEMFPYHEGLAEWMVNLAKLYDLEYLVGTHRGYHSKAEELTGDNITRTGLPISDVIYLDPSVYPDKEKYLTERYGEILLVDDRPTHNQISPLPDNVILIDRPWNQHISPQRPELRVHGSMQMRSVIVECVKQRLNK